MSTAESLKVGDTVRLKSGGPAMTVTTVGDHWGTPTVWCSWFDGPKKLENTFPLGSVETVEMEA